MVKYSRRQTTVVFAALALALAVCCSLSVAAAADDDEKEIAELYEKVFSLETDTVYEPDETDDMLYRLYGLLESKTDRINLKRMKKVDDLLYFTPEEFDCDMEDDDWQGRVGFYVLNRYSASPTVSDYLERFVEEIIAQCGPIYAEQVQDAEDDIRYAYRDHEMMLEFKDLIVKRFDRKSWAQDLSVPMFEFIEKQIGHRPKSRAEFVEHFEEIILRTCTAIIDQSGIVSHFSSFFSPSQLRQFDESVQDWYKAVDICGGVSPSTADRVYNRIVGHKD